MHRLYMAHSGSSLNGMDAPDFETEHQQNLIAINAHDNNSISVTNIGTHSK